MLTDAECKVNFLGTEVRMPMNETIYQEPEVVDQYRAMSAEGLTIPEQYCLNLVAMSCRRSVLDIGIGAGRTTAPLSKLFESYVGIDYSENMINAAKVLWPTADLRTMDARKMGFTHPFDCVMFSFNGIDSVGYEDRRMILKEVARVLRPGGYFIYSTHNLHYARSAFLRKHLLVRELLRPWPRLVTMARWFGNRLRNFRRQTGDQAGTYAYINDSASGFRFLLTYVDIDAETRILGQYGFHVAAAIGNGKQAAGYDARDPWVYIVASRV